MRLRGVIPALALCGTFGIAQAQPIQGVYMGLGAGLRIPMSIKNTPVTPAIQGTFELNQSLGFDTQVSVGYALGNGWRFELEGNYGRSSVEHPSGLRFPANASGSVHNLSVMVNALFDLDVGSPYVYPYMGLGVGYQSTHLDGFAISRTDKPLVLSASGDDGGFAVQAIVGASFPIPNMPGLSLTADYRLMDVLGGERFNGLVSTGGVPVAAATKLHNQFNQTVMFGVRYAFNTPPPASVAPLAMAEPAVGGTRTFVVDFGLDIATLPPRARGVVVAAADSAGRGTTRILVRGVGPYDQAVSERRAKTVAAALVGQGVPRNAISLPGGADTTPEPATGRKLEIVTD